MYAANMMTARLTRGRFWGAKRLTRYARKTSEPPMSKNVRWLKNRARTAESSGDGRSGDADMKHLCYRKTA